MNTGYKKHQGKIIWSCPSNIALIKYWGKKGFQVPSNPSLSMTLENSRTETEVTFESSNRFDLEFYFGGKKNEIFEKKIFEYLSLLTDHLPFLNKLKLHINSINNFPHSAGVASSASSMGALALCLTSLEEIFKQKKESKDNFFKRASFLARLGSGSASRSVFPRMAIWGEESDLYASPWENFHEDFKTLKNAILIVDPTPKPVSSRHGHKLMKVHPFGNNRFAQARKNLHFLKEALMIGDLELLASIVEQEALTLHSLILSSNPPFILLQPKTLEIISRIEEFRQKKELFLTFTLDAGPNPHLLYLEKDKDIIESFLKNELTPFYRSIIFDKIGNGPDNVLVE